MPKTKKSPTKKAAQAKKKASGKTENAIPEAKLREIVKRLESGQSALIEESRGLGFSNNDRLRAALKDHLGGKDKYRAMIERGMKARANSGAAKGLAKSTTTPKKQKAEAKK